MNDGQLGILNVGAGDTKLSFDPTKPAECERAAAVVMDMLKRGYAIMVQVGEKDGKALYMRADSFDPATSEYLIVGLPDTIAAPAEPIQPADETPAPKRQRGRIANRRVAASGTHAVAVAPISGG